MLPAGKDKCPVPRKSPAYSPTQGLTRLPRGQQSHLFDKSEGRPGLQDPQLDPTPVPPAPSPLTRRGPALGVPLRAGGLSPTRVHSTGSRCSASAPPPPPRAPGSPSPPPPRRGSASASTPPPPADAGPGAGGRGRGLGCKRPGRGRGHPGSLTPQRPGAGVLTAFRTTSVCWFGGNNST